MLRRSVKSAYVLLVGVPVLGVLLLLMWGSAGDAVLLTGATAAPANHSSTVLFIVQVVVILTTARISGYMFQRIRQPRVVGEMAAGILLGPSFFGWLTPDLASSIFPPDGLTYLTAISQFGLVVFMFLIGLSVDVTTLRHHGHAAVLISHVSIALPLFLGVGVAVYLYPRLALPGVAFTAFALFMGVAMSITAFPVLARILTEHGMLRSTPGTVATACAAVDDVTGWCLLAAVVAVARGPASGVPLWLTLFGSFVFTGAMIRLVRPVLARVLAGEKPSDEKPSDGAVALCLILAFASAAATEYLGIHLLFGAFLAGVVIPRRPHLTGLLLQSLEAPAVVVLLPVFFALTGLRTSIVLVHEMSMWSYTAVVVVIAIIGKLGGSLLAARCAGIGGRDSAVVGVLMNTRGLMELVVLNVGLDVGVISGAVYSMMVVMTLVTTLMTGPLLLALRPAVQTDRLDMRGDAEPAGLRVRKPSANSSPAPVCEERA
jgi:Kef-type K+ transport system membrane component KefB